MSVNLAELIEGKRRKEIKEFIEVTNSIDLAGELEKLGKEDRVIFFRMLPRDAAAEIFSYLSFDAQEELVGSLTDPEIGHIVNDLFLDDAVDFIEEMPPNVVKRVLRNASIETRKQINHLLQYKNDSAGSMMTTEYVDLREQMTVAEAFKRIREVGMDKETIYTCYVTNEARILDGVISVKTLLLARETDMIGDIMNTNFIAARTDVDREHVAELFQKYDLIALPVIDTKGYLVGIVTVDDAMQVLEEEFTEDFQKMAAIRPFEGPYLSMGVVELAKNRIFWLLVLMFSAFFTGGIITHYESLFVVFPVLIASLPMLMNTSGNGGTQSATLVIRGMAVGELDTSDWWKILWKEVRVGALVGVILGSINVAHKWFLSGSIKLGLTIGLSLFATVTISKVIGSMLPVLAKMVRLDPAIMAAPILTTIVDAGVLMVYFFVATIIMQ